MSYRIEVRIKNAALYKAIMTRYSSVRQFCTMFNIGYQTLCNLMAIRQSPFNKDGEYSDYAKLIGEMIGENVEDIFPYHIYQKLIPRSFVFYKERPTLEGSMDRLLLESEKSKKLREEMEPILSTLTEREKDVIKMRFGIGMEQKTLEEVGVCFRVGRQRVRQIESKALAKLRHPNRSKILTQVMQNHNTMVEMFEV